MTVLEWQQARDVSEVHALIEASDRHAARRSGGSPPSRRLSSTRRLVESGCVQVGRIRGRAAVTVTVTDTPPFDLAGTDLPPARLARYMQRLAVDPEAHAPLLGLQAVRHAIALATVDGADALRAEANPDLADVLRLLLAVGFTRYATSTSGPAPRTYLQRPLTASSPHR